MTTESVQSDDVIQLAPEHCRWGPLLCIVDEVRPWGVIAYAVMPSANQDETMPLRVAHGHYVRIGRAEWATVPKERANAQGPR